MHGGIHGVSGSLCLQGIACLNVSMMVISIWLLCRKENFFAVFVN